MVTLHRSYTDRQTIYGSMPSAYQRWFLCDRNGNEMKARKLKQNWVDSVDTTNF